MKRQTLRYCMDFEAKGMSSAAVLIGLAFFIRIVYYLGFNRTAGGGELAVMLILPGLLELAFIVMLRGLSLDLPRIYGWCAVADCLFLLAGCFFSGSVPVRILGALLYAACGTVSALWLFGIIRAVIAAWVQVGAAATIAAVVVIGGLLSGNIGETVPQLSGTLTVAGMGCLMLSVTVKAPRRENSPVKM